MLLIWKSENSYPSDCPHLSDRGFVVSVEYEMTKYPIFCRHEKQGDIGRDLWLAAGEQGFLGIEVPEELGGIGGTYLDSCIVSEEQ